MCEEGGGEGGLFRGGERELLKLNLKLSTCIVESILELVFRIQLMRFLLHMCRH